MSVWFHRCSIQGDRDKPSSREFPNSHEAWGVLVIVHGISLFDDNVKKCKEMKNQVGILTAFPAISSHIYVCYHANEMPLKILGGKRTFVRDRGPGLCLFVCFVCPSVCLSVCLSVCTSDPDWIPIFLTSAGNMVAVKETVGSGSGWTYWLVTLAS